MKPSGFGLVIKRGAQAGWMIELPAHSIELGRGIPPRPSERRIEVAEPTVSRVQAVLYWYPEHNAFLIEHEPGAKNPTLVNGSPVGQQVLEPDDIIEAGEMLLRFMRVESAAAVKQATGYGPPVPRDPAEVRPWAPIDAGPPTAFALRVINGHPGDLGRVIPLPDRVLVDGNPLTMGGPGGRRNDIALADSKVAPEQARFVAVGGRLHIVPETPSPQILLRSMPVLGPCALAGGEVLTVGDTILQLDSLIARTVGAEGGCLEFVSFVGSSRPAPIALNTEVTIGRVGVSDVVVPDPAVSRIHLAILRRKGVHVLKHLSATNPTLVNNERVSGERVLMDGDEIRISDRTVLRYAAPESLR